MGGGFVNSCGGASDFACGENGSEELREVVFAAPESGSGKPSADYGERGENDKRGEHAPRRLVHVDVMLVVARLTPERQEEETEHIESGEKRGEQADNVERTAPVNVVRTEKNRILGEKAGERWNSGDGQRSDEHGSECVLDAFAQPTHTEHVLFAAHGVNDGAGGEK